VDALFEKSTLPPMTESRPPFPSRPENERGEGLHIPLP
jgi:hypothetical protein